MLQKVQTALMTWKGTHLTHKHLTQDNRLSVVDTDVNDIELQKDVAKQFSRANNPLAMTVKQP